MVASGVAPGTCQCPGTPGPEGSPLSTRPRLLRGLLSPVPPGLCLALLLSGAGAARAAPDRPQECARVAGDAERFAHAGRVSAPGPAEGLEVPAEEPGEPAETGAPSYLSRLWGVDGESRRRFVITPHRSSYILPFTYNTTPNEAPVREANPGMEVKRYEVKFQISFKVLLWQDVLGRDMDLWIAYTQLSFWQVYNLAGSSPFRETDYEPELLLNVRTDYRLLGLRGRHLAVGLNHQSNGQSEPLSRSWNRVVGSAGFERGGLVLVLDAWYPIEEDEGDGKPGFADFLGYGQVNVFYIWRHHRFGLLLRNTLDRHDSKGALQLEWSFPLIPSVSGYVQYFTGYGESLLDYNASSNRIGVGFILKEW